MNNELISTMTERIVRDFAPCRLSFPAHLPVGMPIYKVM